jgi:hypothetical protein
MIPKLRWTLDGRSVDADWSDFSATLGGYDKAGVSIPETQARATGAAQGSVLKAWQDNGSPAYEGRLALDPRYENGLALLSAEGYRTELDLRSDRLVFQTRDLSAWGDATAPPFAQSVAAVFAAPNFQGNQVSIQYDNPTVSSKTFTAKIAAWFPGITGITRYAFSFATAGVTSPSIVVKLGSGPNGTLTTETTHVTSPVDRTVSVANNSDWIVLEISGAVATIVSGLFSIANLRVNGTTGLTDSMYASDVVSYIGAQLRFDTMDVVASPTNVLPLDVTGSWASTLDYMAEVEDWHWGTWDDAGGGPQMDFGPWSRVWHVSLESNASVDLAPLPRYNKVRVWYRDDVGTDRYVDTTASPDPLSKYALTRVYEVNLRDRQADSTLATAVGATLVGPVSSSDYSGRLRIVDARLQDGTGTAYDVRPGDMVQVDDFGQSESRQFRVYETAAEPGGVTLGIRQPASAASLIAKALLPLGRRMVKMRPTRYMNNRRQPTRQAPTPIVRTRR